MPDHPRRLLWTDDDGRERFMFECHLLTKGGWIVDWAHDVYEALEKLGASRYGAMLLDQMLPLGGRRPEAVPETTPWGGYEVLWRLRRASHRHNKAPPFAPAEGQAGWPEPLDGNVGIPVLIISAFYDEDVLAAMRGASVHDRDLVISPKPTNIDEINDFLDGFEGHP